MKAFKTPPYTALPTVSNESVFSTFFGRHEKPETVEGLIDHVKRAFAAKTIANRSLHGDALSKFPPNARFRCLLTRPTFPVGLFAGARSSRPSHEYLSSI